ncbi:hypothetical protein LBMAG42_20080 [Deltaproteobacteria bacterium]|nr:hypothetical protein LBMAG42_20080 [Deltaproteobacteria bacterium]
MDHNLCVLIDYDNIAKGSRQEGLGEFDIRLVMRRLKDIGRVLVARAYCDWERWSRHRSALAEQGVTMMELTATGHGDKNRGDIALAVDAMEIAYTREFVDTFVILSGDSDFTPLVQRLKELNRSVIGIGTRGSTSRLIANVCDEFFFYDSLVKRRQPDPEPEPNEDEAESARPSKIKIDHAFALLVETLENYARDESGPVHGSVVKTSMKRKLPTFNEVELGFRTFARFLDRAQAEGLVTLSKDGRAGGYRVELAPGPNEQPEKAQSAPTPAPVQRRAEPETRSHGPGAAALDVLRNEGFDIGTSEERNRILDAFAAACTERNARGRRLAVQYLQGDLVQQGLDAERVRGVLMALVRLGALLHPDGDPVRGPTAPMQVPASAAELGALLEERALELLGERRIKLDFPARVAIFGDPGAPERRTDAPSAGAADEGAWSPADEERTESGATPATETEAPASEVAAEAPRRRRSRGGRGRRGGAASDEEANEPAAGEENAAAEAGIEDSAVVEVAAVEAPVSEAMDEPPEAELPPAAGDAPAKPKGRTRVRRGPR